MKRLFGIVVAALAISFCFVAVGCSQGAGSADNAITVSASGVADIAPDKANITIQVRGTGESEEAAQNDATRKANDVVARIKTAGVNESDITVTPGAVAHTYGGIEEQQIPYGYYDWDGNWIEEGGYETVYYDRTGEIVGYEITSNIAVQNINTSELSTVLKESVGAGAAGFSDLSFFISDREAAYQAALTAAVDAAHAKAETLANASKVYVGQVVNMVEESDAASIVVTQPGDASVLNVTDTSTLDVSISPLKIEASVTISYAIS